MATILVADDNSNIQKMVALALKDQGIEVFAVGNGEAAVRKLADVQPDLVLADIFMPVRNGYEVCEFVKSDKRFSHIPVVLLVGAFDPLDEREAQRVGADGVLKKPFVPPDPLITMVKSVLAKSTGERPAPVPATVAAPVATAVAALPAELAPEECATPAQHVAFHEEEKPLAFGELLESPPVEAEPEPETTTLPGPGLGEMRFWHSTSTTEERPAEPEAPAWTPEPRLLKHEDSVFAQPVESAAEEPSESVVEAPTPPSAEPPPVRDMASSAGWFEAARAHPVESVPPQTIAPEESPRLVEPEPFPSARTEQVASGWQEPAEEPVEPAPAAWSSPVAPSALAAEPAQSAVPFEAPHTDAVQSFEVPQPPNPELVDAVVARVIERMQPQILDIVTREILKPVVEALVRRELEKR